MNLYWIQVELNVSMKIIKWKQIYIDERLPLSQTNVEKDRNEGAHWMWMLVKNDWTLTFSRAASINMCSPHFHPLHSTKTKPSLTLSHVYFPIFHLRYLEARFRWWALVVFSSFKFHFYYPLISTFWDTLEVGNLMWKDKIRQRIN